MTRAKRKPYKSGPPTQFARLVDRGIRAYQYAHERAITFGRAEAELAEAIHLSPRTLQAWRRDSQPRRYEPLRDLAAACVRAAPDLGKSWVIELFQAGGMADCVDQAIADISRRTGIALTPVASSSQGDLSDRVIVPGAVFQRVRVDEFVGREWLTAKVDRFLDDSSRKSGVFLLVGEAGVGKTCFLAHLVRERGYAHLFAEQVPGEANLGRALESLAAQLVTRYRLSLSVTPHSFTPDPQLFERLLRQAACRLMAGDKMVIVCDGLDEAGAAPDGNVLGLPAVLPDGVYLILSQRPVPVRLNLKLTPHIERLDASAPDNLRDVETYLAAVANRPEIAGQLRAQNYAPSDFIRTLADKSDGVWIYLHHVVGEILQGRRTPLDLDQLPAGLAGYYAEYWSRLRQEQDAWDDRYAPLLTTLGAAQEPVSVEQLMAWAGVRASPDSVRRLLREAWRAFIAESGEQEPRYGLYHASLRDFVAGRVDGAGLLPAHRYLVDDLGERTRRAHRQIVEHYRLQCGGDWPNLAEQTYPRRYLATHLVSGGLLEESFALVAHGEARNEWAEARFAQECTYAGYLADLDPAWRWAESDEGWNVGAQIRCALIQSSLRSRVGNVPPGLVVELVRAGRWSPDEALAHILQIPEERQRGEALCRVFPLLPSDLRIEATMAAREMSDPVARAITLAHLARQDDSQEHASVAQALDVARSIADDQTRAQVIVEMTTALPDEFTPEALAMVRDTAEREARLSALAQLAGRLPDELRASVAREVLAGAREIEDEPARSKILCDVATALPARLAFEALSAAREMKDAAARGLALASLAGRLPARQRTRAAREAWQAAQAMNDDLARAHALADLAEFLPDDLKREALNVARGIANEFTRLFALTALAEYLPGRLKTGVASEALHLMRQIQDPMERAMSFMLVGPCLNVRQQSEALNLAREIANPRARGLALSRLSPHLSPAPQLSALDAARKIQDAWARATALNEMMDVWPDRLRGQIAEEALSAARGIADDWARACALSRLAERLPGELQLEGVGIAGGHSDHAAGFLAEAVRDTLTLALRRAGGVDERLDLASEWARRARDLLEAERWLEAFQATIQIESLVGSRRAGVLAEVVTRWAEAGFPGLGDGRAIWPQTLRALARHRRPELLFDLAALAPLIMRLGGAAAIDEACHAIQDVCRWWP